MKVLDSSFLMDYEHGDPATKRYLEDNADERFVVPSLVYAEFLIGFALAADHTVADGRRALSWVDEIAPVDADTAEATADVVAAVSDRGHALTGVDAIVAGVARERSAPVVAGDSDLATEAVAGVLDVETY